MSISINDAVCRDCIFLILSKLSEDDRISARSTCRLWKELIATIEQGRPNYRKNRQMLMDRCNTLKKAVGHKNLYELALEGLLGPFKKLLKENMTLACDLPLIQGVNNVVRGFTNQSSYGLLDRQPDSIQRGVTENELPFIMVKTTQSDTSFYFTVFRSTLKTSKNDDAIVIADNIDGTVCKAVLGRQNYRDDTWIRSETAMGALPVDYFRETANTIKAAFPEADETRCLLLAALLSDQFLNACIKLLDNA